MKRDVLPLNDQEQASRSTQANQLAESLLARLSHLKTVYTQPGREQANASLMEVGQQIAEFGTDDIIKAIDQRLNQARQEFSTRRNMVTQGLAGKVIGVAESITIDMGNMGTGWERMPAHEAVKMIQEYPLKVAVSQRRQSIEKHLDGYFGESRQLDDFFNNRTNELSAARGLVQGLALRIPQSGK